MLVYEVKSIFMEINFIEVCIFVVLYVIVVLVGLFGNVFFIVVVK